MKALVFFILFNFCFSSFARQKIQLEPQIKSSYIELLNQASDFHDILSKKNTKALQVKIEETQNIIAKLYSQTFSLPQIQQRIHAHKLLSSLETRLSSLKSQNSFGKDPDKKKIKQLFNSFFEIAQVYSLNREMRGKIFYCRKDRSLWIQSENKAQNPINPEYSNCGRVLFL